MKISKRQIREKIRRIMLEAAKQPTSTEIMINKNPIANFSKMSLDDRVEWSGILDLNYITVPYTGAWKNYAMLSFDALQDNYKLPFAGKTVEQYASQFFKMSDNKPEWGLKSGIGILAKHDAWAYNPEPGRPYYTDKTTRQQMLPPAWSTKARHMANRAATVQKNITENPTNSNLQNNMTRNN